MVNQEEKSQPVTAAQNDLQTPSVAADTTETMGQSALPAGADQAAQQTSQVQDQTTYDNIVWPEDISFEPGQVDAFKALAKELHLSAKQVQKLVEFETQAARENAAKTDEEKRRIVADWARQTKAFYGAKLEEEISFALRAANAFGGPEFRALLEETGLGNHPVMLRTLVGIGRCISEDVCPGGRSAVHQDKTFAEALYGKN